MSTEKPEYLGQLLQPVRLGTNVVIRHVSDEHWLHEPRYSTNVGLRAFRNCPPRFYNKLPKQVKDSATVVAFKTRLKTHLFREAYDMATLCTTNDYMLYNHISPCFVMCVFCVSYIHTGC